MQQQTSVPVTIEDAIMYEPSTTLEAITEVAAGSTVSSLGSMLFVTGADGRSLPLSFGEWLVRYAVGEPGVTSDFVMRRYFPQLFTG